MIATHRRFWPVASLVAAMACIFFAANAGAQQHGADSSARSNVPDVPAGDAVVRGRLVHPAGGERAAGASVVLYALSPDGSPGVRSSSADSDGSFRFEGVSSAPGIIYLIGAQFASVPYGERFQFELGQSEAVIDIEVADPTSDTSGVTVTSSSLRVDWVGSHLAIEETHQLENPRSQVIYLAPEDRGNKRPPFQTRLPDGASNVDTQYAGLGDGFALTGRDVSFWGPIYQGSQEVRYRYLLPIPTSGEPIVWPLDPGSGDVSILYPVGGPTISGVGLGPSDDVERDGQMFRHLRAGAVEPGSEVQFAVALPETRRDPEAVQFSNIDVWIEHDDTFQQVTVEMTIDVAEGAYLAGDLSDPLLEFDIPEGSELLGLSPNAQSIGLVPGPDGSLDLVGPLAPGQSNVSYRYRTPVSPTAARLSLHFPSGVTLLNVLIADTGVVIDTQRLHRRRPFRSGTRVFLHRQAFQLAAGEPVTLSLTPIVRRPPTRTTRLLANTGIAAIGVWFVFAPLGGRRGRERDTTRDVEIRSDRELIYAAIRDLDLDYETGNVDLEGYESMQQELRGRALLLLQEERQRSAGGAAAKRTGEPTPSLATAPAAGEVEAPVSELRFCPGCGSKAQQAWRFCAGCGEALPELDEGESSSGGAS